MKTILSTVRGWVVVGVILGSGGAWGQEVCTIPGSGGSCKFNAFLVGEVNTCRKFVKSEYQGTCLNGFLNGLVLLNRVQTIGTMHYLGKFERGVPVVPIIKYYENLIGLEWDNRSHGCVYYGETGSSNKPWDARTTDIDCRRASEFFGNEYLSDETFKAINNGTFRIAGQPQISKPSNNSKGADDPKVFGRSARGS